MEEFRDVVGNCAYHDLGYYQIPVLGVTPSNKVAMNIGQPPCMNLPLCAGSGEVSDHLGSLYVGMNIVLKKEKVAMDMILRDDTGCFQLVKARWQQHVS
jgi:hypothetical protein